MIGLIGLTVDRSVGLNGLTVPLTEIFLSVQGEGKYVGCRQIFIRFADCNLHCAYCDTDFVRRSERRIDDVIDEIKKLMSDAPVHSISLTGGEPLLHVDAIRAIADGLTDGLTDARIFLETNGTLSDELTRVIDMIDIISMDIKLPHSIGKNLFDEHRRFISIARRKDLYVKIVIDGETTAAEFLSAVEMIGSVSREILLVMQPVTPVKKNIRAVAPTELLKFQAMALKILSDVRIIPQTHRSIGLP